MKEMPAAADVQVFVTEATKAPSSHNTQPWIFRSTEGGVLLYADRTRGLPVNDPEDRELTISCGAALFNLRIAAAAADWETSVLLLPDAEEPDLLARIDFTKGREPSNGDRALSTAIERRHTFRKPFQKREIPRELVSRLESAAEMEGTQLSVVADAAARDRLGDLIAEGDRVQFADPSWRRELAAWMHPSRGDGLAVGVAPVTRLVVRSFNVGRRTGQKDEGLAESSPLLAVLHTPSDTPTEWLSVGQALERVLLVAASEGVQASYLNQPCQVAELRPRFQKVLGIPGLPQVVLRMGYPDGEVKRAPRRPVEKVLQTVPS